MDARVLCESRGDNAGEMKPASRRIFPRRPCGKLIIIRLCWASDIHPLKICSETWKQARDVFAINYAWFPSRQVAVWKIGRTCLFHALTQKVAYVTISKARLG